MRVRHAAGVPGFIHLYRCRSLFSTSILRVFASSLTLAYRFLPARALAVRILRLRRTAARLAAAIFPASASRRLRGIAAGLSTVALVETSSDMGRIRKGGVVDATLALRAAR